ncbi:MAG: hypothetical protein GWO23_10410, partial [Gammaproteobacteria bacterium]|nr:hypothetical protein [Phycisphaerae bacterium]NIQ10056.1 hypothetical protein [Gammaproteobacteria bacterium]NIW45073.1 hypothetical protein [Gammaproteobacteria bacterium]NIW97514.1 hypothetical protein [Phycisphaerae bacterium]NIX27061.1 hypothetical protein [Phycisphaerae bacterium]
MKPKKLLYNAKERKMLTYCIGIADIVWQVALKRKQGKSIIDVKKEYEGREETRLIHATIHKVYRESFKSPWRYTETFYNECAN